MDLFDWVHGEYELNIKDMDPDNVITLNISTENLILEGIRRCRAWSQVTRGIGGIDTVYLHDRQHRGAVQARAVRGGAGGADARERALHDRADLQRVVPVELRDLPRSSGPCRCWGS